MIDSRVIKFIIATIISAIVIEIVASINKGAAIALAAIIIIGLLLNNQIIISLISVGAESLKTEVSP